MKIQRSPRVLLFLLAIALPGGVLLLLLPLMNGVKTRIRRIKPSAPAARP